MFKFLTLLMCFLASSALATSPKKVLIVASDFVTAGKFHQLALISKEYGITVDYVYAQNAGILSEKKINNTSLVILDGPRPSDRAAAEAALPEGTAGLNVPWIQVGGGRPSFGQLPPNIARSLIGYYANGTTQNYQSLFSVIKELADGKKNITLPTVVQLKKQGVYVTHIVDKTKSTKKSNTKNNL